MALITWSDEISVGVKKFDDQHKVLIDRLNELHDAMKSGKSNEVIGKVLDSVVEYTIFHFQSEEEAFDTHEYPAAEAHRKEHKGFTDKAAALQSDFKAGKLFISVEVMNFLIDWVQKHIQGSDAAYAKFFSDKEIA